MSDRRISVRSLYRDLDRSIAEIRSDCSRLEPSRRIVEQALAGGEPVYGVNTGFGALARERIASEDLGRLQRNLLLSHAVGVGAPLSPQISRLMLGLKIHALAIGYSGISTATFARLLEFWERDLIPVIPSRGSLGASGDLAPLAHMSLPLIGGGYFWDGGGEAKVAAAALLEREQLEPLELKPKDGLCLINGTQMMSACGGFVLEKAARMVRIVDLIAAMSLEALQGSIKPFDPRFHELRPHAGAQRSARNVCRLLADSEILESHRHCGKVQDPYSLRCVPAVHGASRHALAHAEEVVEIEINSVTDNPLVFEEGDVLSGGNFHGQPLALVLDYSAIALSELASIAERRVYLLLEGHDGLPPLLMRETGINSGFMIPQYTAAALVSENKVLCHPASVDSIPTSLGQEDHVSMGSTSALKLLTVMENAETVAAIELLTAAQALDYRRPLKPGRGVDLAHAFVRSAVPHREKDADFQEDLARCLELVQDGELLSAVEGELGELD